MKWTDDTRPKVDPLWVTIAAVVVFELLMWFLSTLGVTP